MWTIILQHELPKSLEDIPLRTWRQIYYQNDGGPSYFSRVDWQCVNRHCRKGGAQNWPPSSPDFNSLYYKVKGYTKLSCTHANLTQGKSEKWGLKCSGVNWSDALGEMCILSIALHLRSCMYVCMFCAVLCVTVVCFSLFFSNYSTYDFQYSFLWLFPCFCIFVSYFVYSVFLFFVHFFPFVYSCLFPNFV